MTMIKQKVNNLRHATMQKKQQEMLPPEKQGVDMTVKFAPNVSKIPTLNLKNKEPRPTEVPVETKCIQGSYRKLVPMNADGSYASVIIPATVSRTSSGVVIYPSVAILRAFGMRPQMTVDTQIATYEGRLGLLITHTNPDVLIEQGVVRKRVLSNKNDRFGIPVAKVLRELLVFNPRDVVSCQFIPEKLVSKKVVEPVGILIYKTQEVVINRKKSLLQEALELAVNLKHGRPFYDKIKKKRDE